MGQSASLLRGGERQRIPLDDLQIELPSKPDEFLDLDESVECLGKLDRKKAELVKLRYFAGLTISETARVLGISTTTADRYWAYARAWLHQEVVMLQCVGDCQGREDECPVTNPVAS